MGIRKLQVKVPGASSSAKGDTFAGCQSRWCGEIAGSEPPGYPHPARPGLRGEGRGAGCGLASCGTLAGQGGRAWSRKSLSARSGVHANLEALNPHTGL